MVRIHLLPPACGVYTKFLQQAVDLPGVAADVVFADYVAAKLALAQAGRQAAESPVLLPLHLLGGEAEFLILGGEYRVQRLLY